MKITAPCWWHQIIRWCQTETRTKLVWNLKSLVWYSGWLFMPLLLLIRGAEGISGACSQSAAWRFLDRASGTAGREDTYTLGKWHKLCTLLTSQWSKDLIQIFFFRKQTKWQQNLQVKIENGKPFFQSWYSPCTQGRWTLVLPLLPSFDHDPWPSSSLPVSWHFSAETESSDAHVPFWQNLKRRKQGKMT